MARPRRRQPGRKPPKSGTLANRMAREALGDDDHRFRDAPFPDPDTTESFDPGRRQYSRQYPGLKPHPMTYFSGSQGVRSRVANREEGDLVPHSTYPEQTTNVRRPRSKAAGYDPESQQMRVQFRDNARYVYYDVPPEIWEGLLSTDSIGHYIDDNVIPYYTYDQETWNTRST